MAAANPIPTLNVSMGIQATLGTILGTPTITGTPNASGISPPGITQSWQNSASLTGGAQYADQILYTTVAITASGTVIQNVAGTFTNLLNVASATFGTGLSGLYWFLPTVAQAAAVGVTIAVQASSVTIGNTASQQFLGPFLNAASAVKLFPGDIVGGIRTGATTWLATSGATQNLLFTNNDVTNAATVICFYIGT